MTLESLFPDLAASGYEVTSPHDPNYNCVAWAAEDDQRWWEPLPGYYWPEGVERISAVKGAIETFKSLGYEFCADKSLEVGYGKVAIYAVGGTYSHVARQLESGRWASKIGGMEDIEHQTLEGLHGKEYGTVVYVMRRKR